VTERFRVRLSSSALRAREELRGQARTRCDNALRRLAIRAARRRSREQHGIRRLPIRDGEAYSVRFGHYLALCEVIEARRLIVVYAILHRSELERRLDLPYGFSRSQLERMLARRP
jgi:mRNA-degrading endonuclease RelE of RelBE toxin-antitoxin system